MALLGRIEKSLRYRAAKASWKAFEAAKPLYQTVTASRPQAHLFIVGCQRSGTTHLERLFRADPRATVFGEFSDLSIEPGKTVWRSLDEIRADLATCRGSYTVARSLLVSDRIDTALDAVPGSRAIWVWRDMRPVVASMIRKWGADFRAVSERVETDHAGHWALADLWARVEDEAGRHEPREGEGAVWNRYALYWLYRNQAYAETRLERDPRIFPLAYDALLADPRGCIATVLAGHGLAPPQFSFPLRTVERASGRRPASPVSDVIAQRCDAMRERLHAVCAGGMLG